jgi:hypothetical protein
VAHFAQLDNNNVVTQIIVVHNNELGLPESEAKGIEFCQSLFGADTKWVQTSYNNNFRGRFAGVGDTYDAINDVFIPPSPTVQPTVTLEIPMLTTSDLQSLTTTGL